MSTCSQGREAPSSWPSSRDFLQFFAALQDGGAVLFWELFVCCQDMMHDAVTRSTEKQVRKTEQECAERSTSAIFGPTGLSGRCKQLMSPFKQPAGSKGRQAWCTWPTTLGDNGRICWGATKYGLVTKNRRVLILVKHLADVPRARNVAFSSVRGRMSKQTEFRFSQQISKTPIYTFRGQKHFTILHLTRSQALFLLLLLCVLILNAWRWQINNLSLGFRVSQQSLSSHAECQRVQTSVTWSELGEREILAFDPAAKACILS